MLPVDLRFTIDINHAHSLFDGSCVNRVDDVELHGLDDWLPIEVDRLDLVGDDVSVHSVTRHNAPHMQLRMRGREGMGWIEISVACTFGGLICTRKNAPSRCQTRRPLAGTLQPT